MKDLKQILATVLALGVMSGSALAFDQRKRDDNPPPPKEVKLPKKEEKRDPPPRDENRGRGDREGRRGRP